MTGFGHAERSLEKAEIVVDIRGVNSRYFDFKAHLGREWVEIEAVLKSEVQQAVSRGRIDLFVDVRLHSSDQIGLDHQLLNSYLALAEKLKAAGVPGELSIADLIAIPGLLSQTAIDADSAREPVLEATREALARLVEARLSEGAALQSDIEARLDQIEMLTREIAARAGLIQEHYRSKFEAQLLNWGKELHLDEKRLAEEVFYYVQRSDIAEELARLRSHIDRFRSFLRDESEPALGKNLDFLCQEMHREVNTILSKSPLVEVSQRAVAAKTEIDRIREQVQNVE